jgi:hypothetical protein
MPRQARLDAPGTLHHVSRPDLVGGGLIRSVGSWSEVLSLRRAKERVFTDERILGRGDFVETILRGADERLK